MKNITLSGAYPFVLGFVEQLEALEDKFFILFLTMEKRTRANNAIWDVMLDFFENHPEMITKKFTAADGKKKQECLWKKLVENLNSLGFGIKPVAKWQKTFIDWKYQVRQKSAEVKTEIEKTGGGRFHKPLSDQELRLLALLGRSSTDGDGKTKEIGLSSVVSTLQSTASTSTPKSSDMDHNIDVVRSFINKEYTTATAVSSDCTEDVNILPPPTSTGTVNINNTPRSRARATPAATFSPQGFRASGNKMDEYQKETMEVLHSINNNISVLASGVQDIVQVLQMLLSQSPENNIMEESQLGEADLELEDTI
ncbi:hypothetical protein NQ315_017503 [Exocentrus adspersus]|uniref:Regulatory protein zeste n=1 Tax=Exocentrus adspersus TaxID=1586481 RepID=A0AAV8VGL0_9CUCU|nr:hypothetical protein NQ315_008738 [Exocentrus adspersus]KAJ8914409.1 hypothetical protein NQ315_017503 [Exocentrus adspersus]